MRLRQTSSCLACCLLELAWLQSTIKTAGNQEDVWRSLIEQRGAGDRALIGAMIESYLSEGTQPIPKNRSELRYGVSVTDACLGWEVTERMLRHGHAALAKSG